MMKTAATIAAYNGRTSVGVDDVKDAAGLVLSHRMRRKPFSEQRMDRQKVAQSIQRSQGSAQPAMVHEHTHTHTHDHQH
jgi:Mg-chelatase subunit ChlI